jgi:hypothetical protein
MTIYITKEVDIELEEDEVLGEIETYDLVQHVVDNVDAATILDKISVDDIIHYIVKDKSRSVLGNLLRKIADYYDYL